MLDIDSDIDSDYDDTTFTKSSPIKNVEIQKFTPSNHCLLLCLDLDMTLINAKGTPFHSVKWFASRLEKLHPNMYVVIYTLASSEHALRALPDTHIDYDMIYANGAYGKSIASLRRGIPDMKYLNGPSVLIDDKDYNLKGQYDIEINASMYFMRDANNIVYDLNYAAIIEKLISSLQSFWETKRINNKKI